MAQQNISNFDEMIARRTGNGFREEDLPESMEWCLACDSQIANKPLFQKYRVCPSCRFHYTLGARERIDLIADEGTFKEKNRSIASLDPLSFSGRVAYKERLSMDQRRTGLTEAAVTGTCQIGGSSAVLIVLDVGFMGGSMGSVVGEKIARALEHAVKKKMPAIAIVTSEGARIQEGVLSLMQMAKTSIAVNKLAEEGLPFISVLANPTTGQAYASFASLADVILAEPGALVGLAPLRALAEASPTPLPPEAHTAEYHLEHGLLDKIVDREDLRDTLATLLALTASDTLKLKSKTRVKAQIHRAPAWESVQLARHEKRPSATDYIIRIFSNFVELHGDRVFAEDSSVICGIGQLGSQPVVVIGQEGQTMPEGFRKAQRIMKLASKFNLPIVTLIDTPGPAQSLESEERGLGNIIATTISGMAGLPVPSIAVIIGEGGSEAALALGLADQVLMLENAIYSSISPEVAAALIYRDETKAPELAESLKLTAADCIDMRIVDMIVQEPDGGAHTNPNEAARNLKRALMSVLAVLRDTSTKKLLKERYKKFRKMGEHSSLFRLAVARKVRRIKRLRRRRKAKKASLPPEVAPSAGE